MHKSKRKAKPARFTGQSIALILLLITTIAGYIGYRYFLNDADSIVTQLRLPVATVSETDDIQLMDTTLIDDTIRDIAFSEDSSTWYALGANRLYKMELNGDESQLVASVAFPSEYEANTLAVYPDANQIAIGAMKRTNRRLNNPTILFVDMPDLILIDTVFESRNQYNSGVSMELAFTPDGSQLYHLYNLNNAGCGRTSNHLEIWDMSTHTMETYPLPTNFVADFMVTDNMLTLQVNTDCLPSISQDSRLTFYPNDGQEVSFSSVDTTGYQHLNVSADETLFAGILNYQGTHNYARIHIWDHNQQLIHEFLVNKLIVAMTISPDNRYGLVASDGELYFLNLQTGDITDTLQINFADGVRMLQFSPDGHYLLANGLTEQQVWYLP